MLVTECGGKRRLLASGWVYAWQKGGLAGGIIHAVKKTARRYILFVSSGCGKAQIFGQLRRTNFFARKMLKFLIAGNRAGSTPLMGHLPTY
jgi:hypothetical protein